MTFNLTFFLTFICSKPFGSILIKIKDTAEVHGREECPGCSSQAVTQAPRAAKDAGAAGLPLLPGIVYDVIHGCSWIFLRFGAVRGTIDTRIRGHLNLCLNQTCV